MSRQPSKVEILHAVIKPCAQPERMKLRKANGRHKHYRWFWLTVEHTSSEPQICVNWSAKEDFRSVSQKQRHVTAMRPTHEGKARLGFTMEVDRGESVVVVATSDAQRSVWLKAWDEIEGLDASSQPLLVPRQ